MKRLPVIACVFACVFLAACGGGSHEVRLALQPPSTNNYPSYFAQWLGFYDQEGVRVSISQIAGASKVLEAVVGGSADVGGGVYEQAIEMAEQGRDVRCFVSLLKSPNFAIVAAPGGRVKQVADLRGRSAGVSSVGSPSQVFLNHLLRGAGIAPEAVSTVNVGMGATALAALEHQQVDAAVLFGSAITALTRRHPDTVILADTRTPEGLRAMFGVDDYPASCLLVRGEWLNANGDAARRMARAVLKAIAWIREHPAEEVYARLPAESRVGDSAAELEAIRLAQPMYSTDGVIRAESAAAVARVRGAKADLTRTYSNDFLRP